MEDTTASFLHTARPQSSQRPWQATDVIRRPFVQYLLAGIAAFTFFGWIQFSVTRLPEYDSYYHARMAQMLLDHHFLPFTFPYLPLTILSEAKFADHHFLFHAAIAPFLLLGNPMVMAKIAATVFSSLMALTFFFVLRRLEVRWPWFWMLVLAAASEPFLYRMSMLRAQSLGAALLMLGFLLALQRNGIALFIIGFLFAWTYAAFPILGGIVLLVWLADGVAVRQWNPAPVLYAATGMLAGTVIHPYTPNYAVFIIRHAGTKLLGYSPVTVGNEWYPYNAGFLLHSNWLALACFLGGLMFASHWQDVRRRQRYAAALISIVLFILFMKSRRFAEYWVPFAVLLAALTFGRQSQFVEQWKRRLAAIISIGLVVLVGALSRNTVLATITELQSEQPVHSTLEAGEWLDANVPPGERIFHADWDDFPQLFYSAPRQTYLVGLDPMFAYMENRDMYEKYTHVTQTGERAVDVIRNDFASRLVFLTNDHTALLESLRADSRAMEVFQSDCCSIFKLN